MTSTVTKFGLFGEINDSTVASLVEQFGTEHGCYPNSKWVLQICSEGGDTEAGSALYETLYAYSKRGGGSHHITTLATGKCHSMAGVIMQAGDHRVTGELTRWGFHQSSGDCWHGSYRSIRDDLESADDWEWIADELLVKRTKLSVEDYRALLPPPPGFWRLRGLPLLQYGFVDEVAEVG